MDVDAIIAELPASVEDLSKKRIVKKIRAYLPVPNDFDILWAEVNSYGGFPVGMVIARQGVIFKSPRDKSRGKKKYHQSLYQYIPWEYFDVEQYQIAATNIKGEKVYTFSQGEEKLTEFYDKELFEFFHRLKKSEEKRIIEESAIMASIEAMDLESTDFNAAYGADNSKTGHGIYAEKAGVLLDRLNGEQASHEGSDNAKNGPDKLVNGSPVQCKYCKTPDSSIRACFKKNKITGQNEYRYYQLDGKTPMMVEVPKDQYDKAIEVMRKRISKGEIPGVTDPDAAFSIVRQGKLTYKQACNLAKAGTIESLTYDVATGAVNCAAIGGVSAVVTFSITLWQTKDKKKAAKAALSAGLDVFGAAFVGRILAAQIARTSLPHALIPVTDSIAHMLSPQTVQSIMNAFRALAGKGKIYGAAAQKSFAKALRTSVLTQVIIFGVTSVPDTYRVCTRKISGAQYTKNMLSVVASVTGSAGGAFAAGKFAEKKLKGQKTIVKIIGTGGAMVGGTLLGVVTRGIGNLVREDDQIIYTRLINSVINIMCIDYLLSEDEVNLLIEKLDQDYKKLIKLQSRLLASDHQYHDVEAFLSPYFQEIVKKREVINASKEEEMYSDVDEVLISMVEEGVAFS